MASKTATFEIKLLDDVSKPARSISQALRDAETNIKKIAKDMSDTGTTDRFVKSLSKLKLSAADIKEVSAAWQNYTTTTKLAADASQWTKSQAADVRAWEQQTVAAIRAVGAERRREATQERQDAARRKAVHEKELAERREWLKGERSLAGTLGAAAVGGALVEGTKGAIERGADLQQLMFRVREMNRKDPTEGPFAESLAREIAAKYPAVTEAKALDTYLELRANAASTDGKGGIDQGIARRNLTVAARAQTASLALGFEMTPEDMQNLLKSVEGSGRADDPKAVEKISDAYIRAKQVFGSGIASSMLRDYVANAKSANFSIGDDQFYLANMVRMSEGNASRLGNEVNQTMASLVGGQMKKQTGEWLKDLGLVTADQIMPTGGGNVSIKGGIKGADVLQTDQLAWANSFLLPAIDKTGALADDKVSARMKMLRDQELSRNPNAQIDDRFLRERAEEGLVAAYISKSGARSTVTDNLAHLIGNARLMNRDIGQLQDASGMDAATRINENAVASFKEFSATVANFGAVLASPTMLIAGQALHSLAGGIAAITSSLGDFQKNHPAIATGVSAAALAAGGVGGAALLYGAGSALFGGFGLSASATALDGSAAALTAAAARLGGGAGLPGGGPAGPGGPAAEKGMGWLRWLTSFSVPAAMAYSMANRPALGSQEDADSINATNAFFDKIANRILPAGWTKAAEQEHSFLDAGKFGRGQPSPVANWARDNDTRLNQAYARQRDDHPVIRGERDMEGARGRALSDLPGKAADAKTALEAINDLTVKPNIDLSLLDAAIAKVMQVRAALTGLDSLGGGAVPSLAKVMRGNHTSSGIGHE